MPNIRGLAASDFRNFILSDCQPVEVITPTGQRITKNAQGLPLRALLRMSQARLSEDGVAVLTPTPSLRFAMDDLPSIPKTGEKWAFKICDKPNDTVPTTIYLMDTEAALDGGKTFGWVDIPLIVSEGVNA